MLHTTTICETIKNMFCAQILPHYVLNVITILTFIWKNCRRYNILSIELPLPKYLRHLPPQFSHGITSYSFKKIQPLIVSQLKPEGIFLHKLFTYLVVMTTIYIHRYYVCNYCEVVMLYNTIVTVESCLVH